MRVNRVYFYIFIVFICLLSLKRFDWKGKTKNVRVRLPFIINKKRYLTQLFCFSSACSSVFLAVCV